MMNTKKSSFINQLFLIFSLFCCIGVYLSPADVWIMAFLAWGIPFLWSIGLVFLLIWTIQRNKSMIFQNLIFLLLALPIVKNAVGMSFLYFWKDEKALFSVMSYNVRTFNAFDHVDNNFSDCEALLHFSEKDDADIKCFQEFYHQPSGIFASLPRIKGTEYTYFFVESVRLKSKFLKNGLAIFSKFPIIEKGEVFFSEPTQNQAIYVDVEIQDKIVRIYNVHLQSAYITQNPFEVREDKRVDSFMNSIEKIKKAQKIRSLQVEEIMTHIQQSGRKHIIFCGDLNDLPYSYTYFSLDTIFDDAFVCAGEGFGKTYSAWFPLLRIDYQFFSSSLGVSSFDVMYSQKVSDHFPIKGFYYFD